MTTTASATDNDSAKFRGTWYQCVPAEIEGEKGDLDCGELALPRTTDPRSIDEFLQAAYDDRHGDGSAPTASVCGSFLRRGRYALIVSALGVSSAADAAELFSIGYVLGDAGFQRDVLRDDLAGNGALVAGILTVGLIVGGLGAAAVEHRIGRKAVLLAGLAVSSACGLLCATAHDVASFSMCRFGAGVGAGAVLASQPALSTELSPPRERGLLVSVANGFWTVGSILNAVWALVIFGVLGLSWRIYLVVATLPSVVGFVLILWLVPDSPRYHALHGDYEGAARCANRAARAMGYHGLPLQTNEIESIYSHGCSRLHNQHPSHSIRQAWNSVWLIYKKELRKPTVTIQILWVSASIGAALAYWINTIFQKLHLKNIYLSFILLSCASIPGNIASALLTDRVGRNAFFTASMFLSSMALFAVAVIVSNGGGEDLTSRTKEVVLCTCFYYASLTAVYTVLYVMVSELFPTNVRSTGVAVCSTFGRIASFLAQYVNGALINRPAALLSVGACFLCLGAVVSLVCPPKEMSLKAVLDRDVPFPEKDEEHEMLQRGDIQIGEMQTGEYRSID